MKKLSLVALLITSGLVSGGFKLKDEPTVGEGCRVADPSGTPLNVRSAYVRAGDVDETKRRD